MTISKIQKTNNINILQVDISELSCARQVSNYCIPNDYHKQLRRTEMVEWKLDPYARLKPVDFPRQ